MCLLSCPLDEVLCQNSPNKGNQLGSGIDFKTIRVFFFYYSSFPEEVAVFTIFLFKCKLSKFLFDEFLFDQLRLV